jgi:hypothetical protein
MDDFVDKVTNVIMGTVFLALMSALMGGLVWANIMIWRTAWAHL